MSKNLTATATTSIDADKGEIWEALVTPDTIRTYMFGTNVKSDWRVGSKITWQGEMKGKQYEDKGEILQFEPEKTLAYSHFDPLSGQPDQPENYHTVTIQLSGEGKTTQVSLSQDNNPDEQARVESEKNWSAMLAGLKKYLERTV